MKHYLFAKFFNHFSADELMEKCIELGIDGPTLMVRDGYWVTDENISLALPEFVKTAQKHNLEVKYADTDIKMEDIDNSIDRIKMLKDNGIEQFRLAYIVKNNFTGHVRELEDYTKRLMAHTADVAEKIGIQAIVQNHGYMYPHNASTAYASIKGLDPKYIGIKFDSGNNFAQEGFEVYSYQIPLLGEYISAIGAKDACLRLGVDKGNGNKGWSRPFVPAFEGCSNYKEIFAELKKINFNGPAILMPFYNEKDYNELEKNLIKEIAYFKTLETEAGL